MTFQRKTAWAGDDFLSRCVNLLIHTPPIYAVMKQQARQVLIKTAEQNGTFTVTFYLSWRHIGVVQEAKLNPAYFSA